MCFCFMMYTHRCLTFKEFIYSEISNLYSKVKEGETTVLKNVLKVLPEGVMIMDREASKLSYANNSAVKILLNKDI